MKYIWIRFSFFEFKTIEDSTRPGLMLHAWYPIGNNEIVVCYCEQTAEDKVSASTNSKLVECIEQLERYADVWENGFALTDIIRRLREVSASTNSSENTESNPNTAPEPG